MPKLGFGQPRVRFSIRRGRGLRPPAEFLVHLLTNLLVNYCEPGLPGAAIQLEPQMDRHVAVLLAMTIG